MQVKVETTRENYIQRLKMSLRLSFKRMVIIALAVGFLCDISQESKNFVWRDFITKLFLFSVIVLVVMYVIVFFKSYKHARAALKKLGEKPYITIYTLGPDGINIDSEKGNIFLKWFEIKKISSRDGNIIINLRNKTLYGIPESCFDTADDKVTFLQTAKQGVDNIIRENIKPTLKLYKKGYIGFIPIAGAVNGIIMVVSGISKFRDVKYTLIGFAGIAFNALMYFSVIYYTNGGNFNMPPKIFRYGFTDLAQMQMNSLVKELEFFKVQNGSYPDSLKQLDIGESFIYIHDPMLQGKNPDTYIYHKIGKKYTLFSSGVDQIPNTADDVYPSLKIDTSKIGLIIKN